MYHYEETCSVVFICCCSFYSYAREHILETDLSTFLLFIPPDLTISCSGFYILGTPLVICDALTCCAGIFVCDLFPHEHVLFHVTEAAFRL